MGIERTIGSIDGVDVGDHFDNRMAVLAAKLHQTNQKGISWLRDERDGLPVADAIVLNGGYIDDDDRWTWMRYTGASKGNESSHGRTHDSFQAPSSGWDRGRDLPIRSDSSA
ncbi:YDG/SRA domain-containing protein [Streptomyces sp. M41]|uniref:YDG/SRA domain-containing protein n=1 Tax=Streptomyces sp. M41 TaxID=3059412 RepID=UPI00374CAD55